MPQERPFFLNTYSRFSFAFPRISSAQSVHTNIARAAFRQWNLLITTAIPLQ